ncbi:MAG: hypothetical protein M1834_001369 [Cirrosporium novae-zelandiae]|nr:MAG: hypothetical protein M1834_001369 [Cirrosporium novae-zelandiae]
MSRYPLVAALAVAATLILISFQLLPLSTVGSLQAFLHATSNIGESTKDDNLYLLGGYADPKQIGTGLRSRLYSRAFIIGDPHNPEDRIVYLILDIQSGDTAIRYGILEKLRELGKEFAVYGRDNVAVTATHSHSGPGAWLNYLLPQITSKGFNKQSYQAIVDGAVLSIQRAHNSLTPGYISLGTKELLDTNINRSPYAYLANPKDERDRYDYNVDKTITMLKFQRADDKKSIGVLSWFPVHGTSLYGNNTLIAGDNKGVAASLFEMDMKDDQAASDDFVAGFSQANVGDTSPNTLGAYCEDTGLECDFENSTCGDNGPAKCHGRGPYFNVPDEGASSCYGIGFRQYYAAKTLYVSMLSTDPPSNVQSVRGPTTVKSTHSFHSLSNYTFHLPDGTLVRTCPAALGYSFAAGTTDGPGAFDFTQNTTDPSDSSPLWLVVRKFMHEPSPEQQACHDPKPILMDVGEIEKPYLWTPNTVDIQLLRAGPLLIIVSPGEATTMAGRRWKESLSSAASFILSHSTDRNSTSTPFTVVLGGPSNTYTHYISTPEEYSIQRYEGASTLYGPHTLDAYINLTLSHLPSLSAHARKLPLPNPSSDPPIHINKSLSFIPGVILDRPPFFKNFGNVIQDAQSEYRINEDVHVRFVGANPRNNLHLEGTYLTIEKLIGYSNLNSDTNDNENSDENKDEIRSPSSPPYNSQPEEHGEKWDTIRTDADWDLVFKWHRVSEILGTSDVEAVWEGKWHDFSLSHTDSQNEKEGGDVNVKPGKAWRREPGVYRIRYFGDSKAVGGEIGAFEGVSRRFRIKA